MAYHSRWRGLMATAALAVATTVIAGCGTLQVTDPASPFYLPPPGSVVTIHRRLEVPAGMTRVFLQSGRPVAKSRLDEYGVNCDFEVNTLTQQPRPIAPGRYTVTRTVRRSDTIVQHPSSLLQLAAISLWLRIGEVEERGGQPMMFELVEMRLQSEQPSDLRQLACRGAIAEPDEMELPTLTQMQQALGSYATIQPLKGVGDKR